MVLVGAPVSLQQTFRTIQEKSKIIYEGRKDSVNLKFLKMLMAMDSTQLEYGSYSFMHAMQNGFYTPK
jgi:proline iminopeptidase